MGKKTIKTRKRTERSTFRESLLMNYGLKFVLGISVVLIFLTAVQCTIKKPESPTWTTNLTVPLVNRTYLMPEIIERIDQPNIYLDSTLDSTGPLGEQYYSYTPVFAYSDTLDTISVDDNLTAENISHFAAETLGEVTIYPDNPSPIGVNLGDYVSLILDSIPPSSFDVVDTVPDLGKFSEASISEGTFDIIIANDFGVDLDTVIIRLYDITFAGYVSTDTIPDPGLAAGDVDTVTVDLAGKTISNDLQMQIHCHTPGSGPSFTLSGKTMTSAVELDNGFVLASATAQIPEITKNFQQLVDLVESNTIQSAILESGNISVQINNATELETDFQITVNDFSLSGNPLLITRMVPANTSTPVNIDLTGYTFAPLDQTAPQSLALEIDVVIDSTAPSMVTIDQYDSLSVNADISNLAFSSMTGIIQETDADFDNFSVDIDLPKGFDEIQLSSAILTLEIENAVDFAGTLDLLVSGNNGQNLNISGSIDPGSFASPVVTTIQETDIASFLNPIPTNITVSGTATFGDGVSSGTVTANDFVVSRIHINSPLEVIIGETSFEGDVTSETIEQDDIDLVTEHVVEARFIATIINHLPIGVTAEIYLDGDSTQLNAADAQLVIGPISVDPGVVDPSGVVVTEATITENVIVLDSLEIKILENDILYTGQLITLMDTDGNPVRLSGDDYYTAQGVIEVEYKFDGEF